MKYVCTVVDRLLGHFGMPKVFEKDMTTRSHDDDDAKYIGCFHIHRRPAQDGATQSDSTERDDQGG
jgi:hypothetical protein